MASVDLKDVFFNVPINVHDQKYLKLFGIGLMHLQPCLMATLMLCVYSLKSKASICSAETIRAFILCLC